MLFDLIKIMTLDIYKTIVKASEEKKFMGTKVDRLILCLNSPSLDYSATYNVERPDFNFIYRNNINTHIVILRAILSYKQNRKYCISIAIH